MKRYVGEFNFIFVATMVRTTSWPNIHEREESRTSTEETNTSGMLSTYVVVICAFLAESLYKLYRAPTALATMTWCMLHLPHAQDPTDCDDIVCVAPSARSRSSSHSLQQSIVSSLGSFAALLIPVPMMILLLRSHGVCIEY